MNKYFNIKSNDKHTYYYNKYKNKESFSFQFIQMSTFSSLDFNSTPLLLYFFFLTINMTTTTTIAMTTIGTITPAAIAPPLFFTH